MTAETLDSVIGRAEFAAGLRFGLAAVAVGLAVAVARREARPLPVAGLLFAAAFAVALGRTLGLPGGLALGLVVLGGAGMAGRPRVALLLAILGAFLLVSGSGVALEPWARLLVGTAIVLGGWLSADLDARWRRPGLGPVLLAISVAGVYATVPDTERALVALGAALPLAFLGWPWPLASLGRAGAFAATGALLWVVAAGSGGRGGAVVAGVGCLGLLAAEPAARLLDPGRESGLEALPGGGRAALAVLLHLGLVYGASRVAGLRPTLAGTVAVVLLELAAAVALALVATATRRRAAGRRPPGVGGAHSP